MPSKHSGHHDAWRAGDGRRPTRGAAQAGGDLVMRSSVPSSARACYMYHGHGGSHAGVTDPRGHPPAQPTHNAHHHRRCGAHRRRRPRHRHCPALPAFGPRRTEARHGASTRRAASHADRPDALEAAGHDRHSAGVSRPRAAYHADPSLVLTNIVNNLYAAAITIGWADAFLRS